MLGVDVKSQDAQRARGKRHCVTDYEHYSVKRNVNPATPGSPS
jgi:hypothetical protein